MRRIRFYFDLGLGTAGITISAGGLGSAKRAIATFTLTSYAVLPIQNRTRRLAGGGMTTTFVSMTHNLTLGHEPRK
jgi:hypothetical protein